MTFKGFETRGEQELRGIIFTIKVTVFKDLRSLIFELALSLIRGEAFKLLKEEVFNQD